MNKEKIPTNFNKDNNYCKILAYTTYQKLYYLLLQANKDKKIFNNEELFSYKNILNDLNNKDNEYPIKNVFTKFHLEHIESLKNESKKLKKIILNIQKETENRKLWLVPNFRYGYLPTIPIIKELKNKGIKIILKEKIGSSDYHNYNKNTLHSIPSNTNFLSKNNSKLKKEKPIIISIDGTNLLWGLPDSRIGLKEWQKNINEEKESGSFTIIPELFSSVNIFKWWKTSQIFKKIPKNNENIDLIFINAIKTNPYSLQAYFDDTIHITDNLKFIYYSNQIKIINPIEHLLLGGDQGDHISKIENTFLIQDLDSENLKSKFSFVNQNIFKKTK